MPADSRFYLEQAANCAKEAEVASLSNQREVPGDRRRPGKLWPNDGY